MQVVVNGLIPCVVVGYFLTILIETPVLIFGLSSRHSLKSRIVAGFLLTACSYPFVSFLFPVWFEPQSLPYLWTAETFAPVSECFVFWLIFCRRLKSNRRALARDFVTIVSANLLSFAVGEMLKQMGILQFQS